MKIRVLRGFAGYRKGQVFDNWPDGMCELLIRRGVVERLEERQVEEAVETHDAVERAEMPQASRKKKR